jgi:hypothetical protein
MSHSEPVTPPAGPAGLAHPPCARVTHGHQPPHILSASMPARVVGLGRKNLWKHSYFRTCRPLVLEVSGKEFPNSEPTRPTSSVASDEATQAVRPAQIVLKRNRPVAPTIPTLIAQNASVVFTPRHELKRNTLFYWCRWRDSNPHDVLPSRDFKSRASAISPHRLPALCRHRRRLTPAHSGFATLFAAGSADRLMTALSG